MQLIKSKYPGQNKDGKREKRILIEVIKNLFKYLGATSNSFLP